MTFARCTVLTILIYLLLAMIASLVLSAFGSGVAIVGLPVVVLISLTVIHLWVPGENPNRTFNDEKERQKFKKLSRFFIVLWVASCYLVYLIAPGSFGIYFVSTASGILWQSFFVTPAGYKLLNALEHLFRFL